MADLAAASREIESRYGLASIEGGRHGDWGTANRIVPLGEAYLELVSVVDEAQAARSPFGSWVAEAQSALTHPLGWAVRTDKLEAVARRLSLAVSVGSRAGGSGQVLRWRFAGLEQAAAEPSLPFFIEWGQGTPHPGRAGPPIGWVPCGSQSYNSTATPIASPLGSDLTVFRSPSDPGRPGSRVSS